ncbi:Mbeg1-like protein [Sutcliffiella sp. NPDC057660]|uniref:Mbeg1-like protein n=1 Tax=Sutcliffiella sp. NPDC057660 TaxID=3346199 RepID=UPI0036C57E96
MSLSNLTPEEKNILLQLSYIDVPPNIKVSDKYSYTLDELIAKIELTTGNKLEDNDRMKTIQAFIQSDAYQSSNLKDVKLVGYQNHNPNDGNNTNGESHSGFVGYAYKDDNGNATAVFRGSENPGDLDNLKTDWSENGQAFFGMETVQQREANEFYANHVALHDGEKNVLGHSKGGNLASYVYVNNLDDNNKGYVINGAPLWWWGLNDTQKEGLKNAEAFSFIVYDGDIVSQLGYAPYVTLRVGLDKKTGEYTDPFYPHAETSVAFDENGNLVNVKQGGSFISDIQDFHLFYENIESAVKGFVTSKAEQIMTAISDGAKYVIAAINKGLTDAANFIKEQTISLINKIETMSKSLENKVRGFFEDVGKKASDLFGKVVSGVSGFFGGTSLPQEPYVKVDLHRLAYYSSRLQSIKSRTNHVNSLINSLYGEVGIFGLDNLIKADILSAMNNNINQNIAYLNQAREFLQKKESYLVSKANSIR